MTDRILAIILGTAFLILSWVLPIMFPNLSRKWVYAGFTLAILLIGGAVGTIFMPVDAQPPSIGNCNAKGDKNTYSGNDCSTHITAPQYAQIGQSTINQIKEGIPAGSRVTVSTAMQDAPTSEMAGKLIILLKQLGYNVDPLPAEDMGISYFKGFTIQKQGGTNDYDLIVGDTRVN